MTYIIENILLIGNFGFNTNDLNGQTIKTRTIMETIKEHLEEAKVNFVDTSYLGMERGERRLFTFVWNMIKYYIGAKKVLLLPAQRAIKALVPIIMGLNSVVNKDIHYIAIGGWLYDFLCDNPNYTKWFHKMQYIYVESHSLKKNLETLGLRNIIYFPNYRIFTHNPLQPKKLKKIDNFLFFSRVMKEKGIEYAMEAISKINAESDLNLKLSIYGPIAKEYENEFRRILGTYNNICYKGVIEPDSIVHELEKYDIMLFPTYYHGEGFAGALIDALSSGVPVIASNWKYNSEIIKDGSTGKIFEVHDLDDLVSKIYACVNNSELVLEMKNNAIKEARSYDANNVAPILINKLLE